MPNFKYKAISYSNTEVSGVIEAYDEFEAVSAIKRENKLVTNIVQVDKKKFNLTMKIGSPKIKEANLALMCSQFAIILKAGMPIVRCVTLIAAQTTDRELRELLERVAEDVSTGYGLAQSFENKGLKMLPTTFIETIRAGEESGTLEVSFAKLHVYFDRNSKTRKKVKSAMTYPAFLIVLAILVIGVVLVVALPVFLDMFESFDIEMPAPTRFLIAASDFFVARWPVLLSAFAGFFIIMLIVRRTEKGRLLFAKIQLKLPVLGEIANMRGAAQFANTMATMLSSGLTIVKAVALCARVLDNYHQSTLLAGAIGGLEEGKSLGACLEKCGCFPNLLVEMTAVGDETGALENTLETIGEYYNSETELASERALKALEPSITIFMGVIIGYIVISLYLPMFTMYGGMS